MALFENLSGILSDKPHYGMLSAFITITFTTTQMLQIAGIILGLFIALLTAILKIMELTDKIKTKRALKRKDEKKTKAKSKLTRVKKDEDMDDAYDSFANPNANYTPNKMNPNPPSIIDEV